jgi:hypothetical protein
LPDAAITEKPISTILKLAFIRKLCWTPFAAWKIAPLTNGTLHFVLRAVGTDHQRHVRTRLWWYEGAASMHALKVQLHNLDGSLPNIATPSTRRKLLVQGHQLFRTQLH